jgi:hypothetical protein
MQVGPNKIKRIMQLEPYVELKDVRNAINQDVTNQLLAMPIRKEVLCISSAQFSLVYIPFVIRFRTTLLVSFAHADSLFTAINDKYQSKKSNGTHGCIS